MQRPLEVQIHPAVGIIAVAGLFAAFYNTGSLPLCLLMGCFDGAAAWISGSVWTPVALHAASNALIIPLDDVLSELPAVDQWLRATSAVSPLWLDEAAVLLIGGGSVGGADWIYGP